MRRWIAAWLRARLVRGSRPSPRSRVVRPDDFTRRELREFLDGDLAPTRADPAFKERLRRELRALLRQRGGPAPKSRQP